MYGGVCMSKDIEEPVNFTPGPKMSAEDIFNAIVKNRHLLILGFRNEAEVDIKSASFSSGISQERLKLFEVGIYNGGVDPTKEELDILSKVYSFNFSKVKRYYQYKD